MAKESGSENSLPNIIGNGTKITGDIETGGDLRIDGIIDGNIISKGKLVLGQAGSIKGSIKCSSAELSGSFEGKVDISDLLSLRNTAVFKGEIHTTKLSVEPGAIFNGNCSMGNDNLKTTTNVDPKKIDKDKI